MSNMDSEKIKDFCLKTINEEGPYTMIFKELKDKFPNSYYDIDWNIVNYVKNYVCNHILTILEEANNV